MIPDTQLKSGEGWVYSGCALKSRGHLNDISGIMDYSPKTAFLLIAP